MNYYTHSLYYIFTIFTVHTLPHYGPRKYEVCNKVCYGPTLPHNTHALFAERGNGKAVGQPTIIMH